MTRNNKQQGVDSIDSFSTADAAVALMRQNAIKIDNQHLFEGLPIDKEGPSDDLLTRALLRFGYEPVWIDQTKVTELEFPCAIELSADKYLVAVDKTDSNLYILNSVSGNGYQSISIEQIQTHLSGRTFQVLPSTDLLLEKHSGEKSRTHWFWGRIFLQRRSLFDVFFASLFANILAVVTALFSLQVYDRVLPGQSEATLWVLASGVGLAIFFEAWLRISRAWLVDHIGKEAEVDISSEIFTRLLGMKLDERPASPGALAYMSKEFASVKDFFTNAAVGVVADLPFAFIFLLLIYGIADHVVWVIAVGAILIVLPNILLQGRMSRLSKESMGGMSSASRLLNEACYGLETVKITRSESFFQRQWEEIIALNAIKTTEQRALRSQLTYWAASIQQATYIMAVITCVYMIFAGQLSTGAIIAIGILTTRTLSPISQLSQTLASWQNMRTSLLALDAIMDSVQERDQDRKYIRRQRMIGRIEFTKVRFKHQGSKSTTLDINSFTVEAGQRFALLGSNGSGKSSFLRLVSGLYQPTEGEILIDGLDVRQIDPGDLRRNIGFLPQEIQMFRGTLRDNLCSEVNGHSDDILLEALNFGGLSDFVRHHPQGLDLEIVDGGGGLSIGQRQSIGLARLYLQNPAIVLLDEPTSALDQKLESTIVSRIGNWLENRTCIIATHRPLILEEMSHVAVLQNGGIIIQGERDDILSKLITTSAPKVANQS